MPLRPQHLWLPLLLLLAGCAGPSAQRPQAAHSETQLSPAQRQLRAAKLLRGAQAAASQGDLSGALPQYKEALRLYREQGDHAGQAAVHNDLGLMLYEARQHERAALVLEQVRDHARDSGEAVLQLEAHYNLGRAYDALGRLPDAERELAAALALAQQDREMLGLIYNARGNARRRADQMAPAIEDYQAAQQIWTNLLRPTFSAVALMNQGYCQVLSGQPQAALESMQRARQELEGEQGPERDALASHLEEMARLLQQDPPRARERVLELLGRAAPSAAGDVVKP